MRNVHNLMLEEIENYLNIIFHLSADVSDKELNVFMIEFEIKLDKAIAIMDKGICF